MKVQIISQSDIGGGAARAAYRLHRSLLDQDIDSGMKVRLKKSDDWTVRGPCGGFERAGAMLRPVLGGLVCRMQKNDNVNLHSGNWLPSRWAREINASGADVVNLHWVGMEALSIEDIGRIRKPMVWTLHDMWPFCGMEHYTIDGPDARWRSGYGKSNRSALSRGPDLDRLSWLRKVKSWKKPMHIVAPSRWLADCARDSAIFRHWPISVIPNALDTETYRPLDRALCRSALGLPPDRKIILFGAMGGGRDPRKGYDLLTGALGMLAGSMNPSDMMCVVFGQGEPKNPPQLPFPIRWMGHVQDDVALALLYNSADVTVVPSRQENLPQTATESLACGTPVVAFNVTGLPDAVAHQVTGYLAEPFSIEDMAKGIQWVLADSARYENLSVAARQRALQLWSPGAVVPQYVSVYESMMGRG